MPEFLTALIRAPLANLLIVLGAGFLALAVLGRFKTWFALTKNNRYASGGLGAVMVVVGLVVPGPQPPKPEAETIKDVSILVTAAAPHQPTTKGQFYIDGKYRGSITQTHEGGGKLGIGPLLQGEHQFTMDLTFDPPFAGSTSFSCNGTFSVTGPSLFMPSAITNSAGALTECILRNVQ